MTVMPSPTARSSLLIEIHTLLERVTALDARRNERAWSAEASAVRQTLREKYRELTDVDAGFGA